MTRIQYLGINLSDIRYYFKKTPLYIVFSPTSRCNLRCDFCFNWKNLNKKGRKELTLEEIDMMTKNMGHVKYLTITGGEPFLREDLAEITELFYRNAGTKSVAIHTNCSMPKKVVSVTKKILESCPGLFCNICVSIDAKGRRHDKIRNFHGLFKKVLLTIASLKKLQRTHNNLGILGVACVTKLNYDSIKETYKYAVNELSIPFGYAMLRGDVRRRGLSITADEYAVLRRELKGIKSALPSCGFFGKLFGMEHYKARIVEETLFTISNDKRGGGSKCKENNCKDNHYKDNHINKKPLLPCQAGRKVAVIMDNGDVYPCELFNKVKRLGNLRAADYSLKKLLEKERAKKIIRDISKKQCMCTWECIIPLNMIFAPHKLFPIVKRHN
ncbi:MAG: radical SAM/SPASM domain-containing protein [Candidatus Woesearchaeota archaeon]